MTHQDDPMTALRPRIHQLAQFSSASPLPLEQLVALAGKSPRRHHAGRRRYLAAAAALVSTLLVGNIATATATPSTVPARPIPPTATPVTPGTFVSVAALQPEGSDLARTLRLASDPSGRSSGCVSLGPATSPPPSRLPNVPSDSNIPNTTCAFPHGPGGDLAIGYLITVGDGPTIAYGFVPAAAVRVELNMKKTGIVLFRLVDPTKTVKAEIYGASLGLPIKAWAGPDPDGFRVTSIKAFDGADKVVAELSYGE